MSPSLSSAGTSPGPRQSHCGAGLLERGAQSFEPLAPSRVSPIPSSDRGTGDPVPLRNCQVPRTHGGSPRDAYQSRSSPGHQLGRNPGSLRAPKSGLAWLGGAHGERVRFSPPALAPQQFCPRRAFTSAPSSSGGDGDDDRHRSLRSVQMSQGRAATGSQKVAFAVITTISVYACGDHGWRGGERRSHAEPQEQLAPGALPAGTATAPTAAEGSRGVVLEWGEDSVDFLPPALWRGSQVHLVNCGVHKCVLLLRAAGRGGRQALAAGLGRRATSNPPQRRPELSRPALWGWPGNALVETTCQLTLKSRVCFSEVITHRLV